MRTAYSLDMYRTAESVTIIRMDSSALTVVPSNKSVSICSPQLSVDELLALLKRNVHVSIYRLQLALIHHTRVELDRDRDADDRREEARWVLRVARRKLVCHLVESLGRFDSTPPIEMASKMSGQ
jgi:hypothetical protein